MNTDSNKNLNRKTAIIILVFIVAILITGGVYFLFQKNPEGTNSNPISISKNSTTDVFDKNIGINEWELLPYFSDDFSFLTYYPVDWGLPLITEADALYNEEGLFIWVYSNSEHNANTYDYSVSKYRDSGDDLDSWVGKKKLEIESARMASSSVENVEFNNISAKKICIDGTVSDSPAPACFVYLHTPPYILELTIKSPNAQGFELVKKYTNVVTSNFYLLSTGDNWQQYESVNNGFTFKYPEKELPKDTFDATFVDALTRPDSNTVFQIVTHYGYADDLEKYWYDIVKNELIINEELPLEINIDGKRCFMLKIKSAFQDGLEENLKFICRVNNRLYIIDFFSGSYENASLLMFKVLSSLKFTDAYVVDAITDKFITGQFELQIPNTYIAYDEGGATQVFISFAESEPTGPLVRSFSVGFQETDLSMDACVNNMECLIYLNSLDEYSDITFKGQSAKQKEYEYEEGIITTHTVLKKSGFIYSININTLESEGNSEINNIIESFKFL